MENVKLINKMLKDKYGCYDDGSPRFRIVWSTDQVEKRYGTVSRFYGSIYLGTETGVHELRKYMGPDFKDRWILEVLMFGETKELVGQKHYEPLWVFRGKDGSYQRPIWKGVDFIIRMLFAPKEHKNQAVTDSEEREEMAREVKEMEEMLDTGYVPHMLASGEGIVVPGNIRGDE